MKRLRSLVLAGLVATMLAAIAPSAADASRGPTASTQTPTAATALTFTQVCATARYADSKIAGTACIAKDLGTSPTWYVNDRWLYNPSTTFGGHTDQLYDVKWFGNGHSLTSLDVADDFTVHTVNDTWTEGNNTVWVQFFTTYVPFTDCYRIFFNRAGATSQQYVHNCPG